MKDLSRMELNHACNIVCKKCKCKTCVKTSIVKCEMCLVNCNSILCLLNHVQKVCNKLKKCTKCGVFETLKHNCVLWCNFCKKNIESDHKCYILKKKPKEYEKNLYRLHFF